MPMPKDIEIPVKEERGREKRPSARSLPDAYTEEVPSLADLVRSAITSATASEIWSAQEFRSAVEANLASGTCYVVIVIDDPMTSSLE